MPRTKEDLKKIADDLFEGKIKELQEKSSKEIKYFQREINDNPSHKDLQNTYIEKIEREKLSLARNVAKAVSAKGREADQSQEKGFENYDSQKLFVISYLITEKRLFNDNPAQLFAFCHEVSVLNYNDLFAEIVAGSNPDILESFVTVAVGNLNGANVSESDKILQKDEYIRYAKNLGALLKILRSSEKSDEEKYKAITENYYDFSPARMAKLFIEANFKLAEKYVGNFTAELNEDERKRFLKGYNDNFLASDSNQKPYSGKFFKAIQAENENLQNLPAAPFSKTLNSALREKIRDWKEVPTTNKTNPSKANALSEDKSRPKSVPK